MAEAPVGDGRGAWRSEARRRLRTRSAGKPACDWDDAPAREALVDALAGDAYAVLILLEGGRITAEVKDGGDPARHGRWTGPFELTGRRAISGLPVVSRPIG